MLPPLPDDVIFEILSWVPLKHVCRFRCVSRGWKALISSPGFLTLHKSRAEPLLLSVIPCYRPEVSSVLRLIDIDGNIVREVKKPGLRTINYCFDGHVYVCDNADTVSVIDMATGNVVRTSAELDHETLYNLSVGCAVPSHTYKIVCLMSNFAQQPCKVLTLQDGAKWRRVQNPPTPCIVNDDNYIQSSPVIVKGVMHFLQKLEVEDYVLRFDLETEEWKDSIKGPTRSGDKPQDYNCMMKFNDALCMVQRSSTNVCLIWILTDSTKGTWVNVYTIPMDPTFTWLRPLTVMRDGQKLLFYARNTFMTTPTLEVYDPLTKTWTRLTKFDSNVFGNAGISVLHLDSFGSLKILPAYAPSVLSRLRSCKWFHQLNPLSLFYNLWTK